MSVRQTPIFTGDLHVSETDPYIHRSFPVSDLHRHKISCFICLKPIALMSNHFKMSSTDKLRMQALN